MTQPTKINDGDDEIIYANSFITYEDTLKMEGIYGINIIFTFDEDNSVVREKDIDIVGEGNLAKVSFSSKIRNTLGSGTSGKVELAEITDNSVKKKLLFSLYSSKIGDKTDGLNVSITFYLRKI